MIFDQFKEEGITATGHLGCAEIRWENCSHKCKGRAVNSVVWFLLAMYLDEHKG